MDITITYSGGNGIDAGKLMESLGPHLLWAALILTVVLFIGPRRIADAILNARKIGFAGIEIELRGDIVDVAEAKNINLPTQQQDQLSRRMQRLSSLFAGARFLWIDDRPFNNSNEIRLLRRLGTIVDLATDDVGATRQLAEGVYDVVLSDMDRADDSVAGLKFLPNIGNALQAPMVIFYVGLFYVKENGSAVPQGAFGLTARPDELFNLIMDALERQRA